MPAFWDTSAIIRICVPGQATNRARKLLHQESPVVWWTAPVEVRSALERLRFEGALSAGAYLTSRQRLEELLRAWREVQPSELVRDLACVQLERFRLRAADALHLAAALVWCKQRPRGRPFVSNDEKLSVAAQRAGFDVRST
ncbi:MAG TPA: PIN domain-containing protein [Bryobacteraceae bacterium]|nr:PIN domain-containing protein [Bryobacteraceae bacterium]